MVIAGVNLQLAHDSAKPAHLDPRQMFGSLKSAPNIAWRVFSLATLNVERGASDECIYALFFGVNFVFRRMRVCWSGDEFVITRPKGKLILYVLGLSDVNGRMSLAFDTFVAQIKRNLRRAFTFISNQENSLAEFRFEVVAQFLHGSRRRFPTPHSVARFAPR